MPTSDNNSTLVEEDVPSTSEAVSAKVAMGMQIEHNRLELEKQKDQNQLEFATQALAAQERDREAERNLRRDFLKHASRLWCGLGVFLAIIIIAAFLLDKEDVLLEGAKYLSIFGGGSGFGYYFGFKRGTRNNNDIGTSQ